MQYEIPHFLYPIPHQHHPSPSHSLHHRLPSQKRSVYLICCCWWLAEWRTLFVCLSVCLSVTFPSVKFQLEINATRLFFFCFWSVIVIAALITIDFVVVPGCHLFIWYQSTTNWITITYRCHSYILHSISRTLALFLSLSIYHIIKRLKEIKYNLSHWFIHCITCYRFFPLLIQWEWAEKKRERGNDFYFKDLRTVVKFQYNWD